MRRLELPGCLAQDEEDHEPGRSSSSPAAAARLRLPVLPVQTHRFLESFVSMETELRQPSVSEGLS